MNSREWIGWAVQQTRHGDGTAGSVGSLELAEHQMSAANQLYSILNQYGGALLADSVGLGKTRVALAVAARWLQKRSGQLVVFGPARTRANWLAAASAAGITSCVFVSHQQMSRGVEVECDFAIVDEAHRFRNPQAQRSETLAQVAARSPTLLLTATPVANSIWDLYHLLSVFLADTDLRPILGVGLRTAFQLAENGEFDLTQLARLVTVRREKVDDVAFNRPNARVRLLHYAPTESESWLWSNLDAELSTIPFVLLQNDWPIGLLREQVLRRWEAGPQSLVEILTYLVEFHARWLEVTASGGTLDRREFRTLFGDDFRQGVLGFMFEPAEQLVDAVLVQKDLTRLRALLAKAQDCGMSGVQSAIQELLGDQKLLIFTSFIAAAESMFESLSQADPSARIGLVTGAGARATGLGRVHQDEILRRFAPLAHNLEIPDHQQVQVLVATDCISEGVNLQDCRRVVLGDLPYSPLTIEQRVGRLLRPGSGFSSVDVFLPRPSNWNDSLGLKRRLQGKMDHAESAGTRFSTQLEPQQTKENPLRVLTDLDRLAGDYHDPPKLVRVASDAEQLAALVLINIANMRHVIAISPDGLLIPLSRAFPDIMRLYDTAAAVESTTELAIINQALARIRSRIQSANLSPKPLALDSPQVRAWNLIQSSNNINLDDLRARLLQPMTRGKSAQLEQLMKGGTGPLIRWIKQLPKLEVVTVRLEAALILEPDTRRSRS